MREAPLAVFLARIVGRFHHAIRENKKQVSRQQLHASRRIGNFILREKRQTEGGPPVARRSMAPEARHKMGSLCPALTYTISRVMGSISARNAVVKRNPSRLCARQ